ncbi:MAG: Clp protease ClpP [Bacteroidia bacterium]|nr:Clp protease ClpP [Bacteroidia bacterium]
MNNHVNNTYMGIYSEYINQRLSFDQITAERKNQLRRISKIRGRDILVYASDSNKANAPMSILPADLLPFKDQLSYLKTNEVDIILETPGGIAETVEDMVELIRSTHERLGIIIPGMAKSAGTIFSMAGDEILMGSASALGPIDAQVVSNGKRFSADAFLDGLEKIKKEVFETGKLNPAYIPILQSISPGEIQHFENAQNFSKTLVKKWLSNYKFKYWENHRTTGKIVSQEEKEFRADEIANKLCKHSDWLTHGRSIRIKDLQEMRLEIRDYSKETELNDAIDKYYTLLRMTFDLTGIYKIYETCCSQIYQSMNQATIPAIPIPKNVKPQIAHANFVCPKCVSNFKIQLNLDKNVKLAADSFPYPKDDNYICPNCGTQTNLSSLRLQIEAQTGLKVII